MYNKSTKRNMMTSIMALLLCFSMLLGTTFAWFTDSVASSNNVIQSGKLDVELYWADGKEDPASVTWTKASDNIYKADQLWEPGYTDAKHIMVANEGTLAIKYQLSIIPTNDLTDQAYDLASVIDVYFIEGGVQLDERADLSDLTPVGTLRDLISGGVKQGTLAAGDEFTATIVLKMQESAGNEYQELSVGSFFTIRLLATQLGAEEDSFGDDYDDNAWMDGMIVYNAADLQAALYNGGVVTLGANVELNSTVVVPGISPLAYNKHAAVIPADSITPNLRATNTVTLNLNGFSITAGENMPAGEPMIVNNGALSIVNGTIAADENSGAAIQNVGTLTIEEVTVKSESTAVAVENKGEMTIVEAKIVAESAISSVEGTVVIESGSFAGTVDGKVEISGGDFSGTISGEVEINGGNFSGDIVADDNGAGPVINGGNFEGELDADLLPEGVDGFITSVEDLTKAFANGGNYIVTKNLALTAQVTLAKGTTVSLDLLDHTISATSVATGKNFQVFEVVGSLTVKNGTVTTEHTGANMGWNNSTNVFDVVSGGSLTLENTTVKNLGGSDMAYAVNIGNNGGATLNASNSVIESVNYTAVRVFNNANGDINVNFANGTELKSASAPFFVHFWTEKDLGSKQEERQAYLHLNFGADTKVSRYSGSVSLIRFGFDDAIYFSSIEMDTLAVASQTALEWAINHGYKAILNGDLELTNTLKIEKGVNAVIDLNGKTLSANLTGTGNQDMILVNGNLTVKNGKITLAVTQNQGWNAMSTIFDITAGGVVNLDGVNAENLGGTDMNFVAHLNNWGTATLNVNNSTLKATYVAIRVFNSGYDMNNVTIDNSTIVGGNYAFWVHNYTAADFGSQEKADSQAKLLNLNFTNCEFVAVKSAFRYGMTDSVLTDANGNRVVFTAEELIAALKTEKVVVLGADITMKAEFTNGYGVTGIIIDGQTLDGNGHTLTVTGAGTTWDSAIYIKGGKVQNLKIAGAMRGVFMGTANADVYLDNVSFGTIYTFNSDGANKNYGVYISNSTMNGWTSHSDCHKEVVYTNCFFTEGSGYAYCRPYGPTKFINCTFDTGFGIDKTQTTELVFENCIYN